MALTTYTSDGRPISGRKVSLSLKRGREGGRREREGGIKVIEREREREER